MKISEIISKQRDFFNTYKTKEINFRIDLLKKFKRLIKDNEELLYSAIYDDFAKSEFETYLTEISFLYHEVNNFIKNIEKWSKPEKVSTGFTNFPAKSYIIPEPLGVTLVIGAWNYPYQLSLVPAITSLAAGNTVVLKPSELPENTSKIMAKLINDNFPPEVFHVIEGGVDETTEILKHRFDKIFFTGSTKVGKIIYQSAAKHLTPVTLELGGKSPCFVFKDADLKMTAKRIVWSKFLNAGQTCVAPDYILVEHSIEDEFLKALKVEIEKNYKDVQADADNYLKIINDSNYDRLTKLMDQDKIFIGGQTQASERFISPTVLKNITFDDDIMQEEIFGPLLPVLSFTDLYETISIVQNKPKPLSCYIYTKNKKTSRKILNEVSFGGGAVNDSLMHLTNINMPFGGVGHSGFGSYHGKYGFDNFSHKKSILDKPFWYEPPIKYTPYSKLKKKLVKWLLE